MKCNMGKIDRAIRGVIALCVISAGVYFHSWWGIVGIIPFSTALSGWCPAYVPFGISSCKID